MSQWEKEFSTIRLIIIVIYSSVFVYAMLVYLRIPFIPYVWDQTKQMIFFALLAGVPLMFAGSALIGRQMVNPEKLTEKFDAAGGGEMGLKAAVGLARSGALIMAALGEVCAIYGLILYLLTGDANRPIVFFILSIIHYPLTMARLNKAREEIRNKARAISIEISEKT